MFCRTDPLDAPDLKYTLRVHMAVFPNTHRRFLIDEDVKIMYCQFRVYIEIYGHVEACPIIRPPKSSFFQKKYVIQQQDY